MGKKDRIGVRLDISSTALRAIRLEFPDSDLAKRYYATIEARKAHSRVNNDQVTIDFPISAHGLEMSKSLGGFVLMFHDETSAAAWQDAVCRAVEDRPKEVYIKQYWEEGGIDEALEAKRVSRRPDALPPPSPRSQRSPYPPPEAPRASRKGGSLGR
ncbi:MAG: hypothetical protein Q9160_009167 [Pyrenula sp. 1 TL-2023]